MPPVRRSPVRPLSVLSVVVGAFAATGCGGFSNPWETVYQTHGQVQLAGKPVPGATLVLYPTDSAVPASIRPTASTDAEGRFRWAPSAARMEPLRENTASQSSGIPW